MVNCIIIPIEFLINIIWKQQVLQHLGQQKSTLSIIFVISMLQRNILYVVEHETFGLKTNLLTWRQTLHTKHSWIKTVQHELSRLAKCQHVCLKHFNRDNFIDQQESLNFIHTTLDLWVTVCFRIKSSLQKHLNSMEAKQICQIVNWFIYNWVTQYKFFHPYAVTD